jgi:hypothetical protein
VAPFQEKRQNGKSAAKSVWLSRALIQEINIKNCLFSKHKKYPYSPKIQTKYQKQRNKVTMLLRKAKSDYYDKLLNDQSDPRKLWKIINSACGRKGNVRFTPTKLIRENSEVITGDKELADAFNKYFCGIGPNLAAKIQPSAVHPLAYLSELPNRNMPYFDLKPVCVDVVLKKLETLNEHKSPGADNLPAKLLKLSAKALADPFTHVINECLTHGQFPNAMKIAKVIPIYKNKGKQTNCGNYRPISILPILSKILEGIVSEQLQSFLTENNLITPKQFGFLKGKSTKDALIDFTNKTFYSLNNGNCVLGVFIDFSKAFDTINHEILLLKLSHYKFTPNAINWFHSYLNGRTQCVQLNNEISQLEEIKCGVPQGSILGPTLFILYINDLVNHTGCFTPILYADDTNLFFESRNLNGDIDLINLGLDLISNWCIANKLTLNLTKTNYIVMKSHQNNFVLENQVIMNDHPLNLVDSVKFLGITIDSHLTWKTHIRATCSKIRTSTGLIYIASSFLPRHILIKLYNALINSQLIYCIESWGNALPTNLQPLKIIQNKVLRSIYKQTSGSKHLYKRSNILSLDKLYQLRLAELAYDMFKNQTKESAYVTRHSLLSLPLPPSTTQVGHRRVAYRAAACWNGLPADIRRIGGHAAFRSTLRRHLISLG